MRHFMSGSKRNYYGKGDVTVYRLNRDGNTPPGKCPVFGANVLMLVYGDAFWATYETGDNTQLIATDSMKNFIQRETLNFEGYDLESFAHFLASRFLDTYPQVEGIQLTATEISYEGIVDASVAFAPCGPDRATVRIELRNSGDAAEIIEFRSGIEGFRLLRLGGSAFHGFVRDQYTTLPDIHNRPLHMWLDVHWTYTTSPAAFSDGGVTAEVRAMTHQTFHAFESGSIQQVIYQLGQKILAQIPCIAEVSLEANNRTWDTVVERGETLGVYTDARPPFGCLGLTLKRFEEI
jgi:urate oxidase/2-oxo-4-hydroxy-4-carboxy-5-ureidoimidazoline decarboxylase